ncbi:alkaline phosphatase family protein [Cellulomonas sp. URHD0024]|uniref:alkaline phosphatase family protein n=1 Tax=Cellulomonas sp. URHD0024 TaxID=1302620 RepID=UPI0003F94503|nr:alkaline phosphatase family protein [Cellulomonas sp. URHD0024]
MGWTDRAPGPTKHAHALRGLSVALALLLTTACQAGPTTPPSTPPSTPAGQTVAAAPPTSATPDPSASTVVVSDPDGAPCLGAPPPQRWEHVLWIWFENKADVAVLGSPQAPYLNRVATMCGRADDYHGITHPSLPNYLAATSGSTHDVRNDAGPAVHPIAGPSLFSQVAEAGLEWRSYQEAIPAPCAQDSAGPYAVKHNPAAYYTELRSDCARWDVGLDALTADLAAGSLPAFAFVTPDMCNDTHDCSVATGDTWLSDVLPTILRSRSYTDGTTAVFVTYDEDDSAHDNVVPFVAIAPSVPAGSVFPGRTDHYTLLRTTETMLGLPPLGLAGSASTLPHF